MKPIWFSEELFRPWVLLGSPAPSPGWAPMWGMTVHGYEKSSQQESQIWLEYLQSKLAGKHTFTSKESMQWISLSCEFKGTQKIEIRKLQVMHSSTYRFNWEISIMFCGLFFRKICVRKNSRSFFSPKKAANSFLGRPSEDRTAAQAPTDFGQNWHCSTSSFGWARNAGLWAQSGKWIQLLRIEIISSGDDFSNPIPLIPSKIDPEAKSLRILHGPLHC